MRIRLGVCQLRTGPGDPRRNAEAVCEALDRDVADVLVFPESFVTGYGHDLAGMREETESAVGAISDRCRETGKAVAIGSPRWSDGSVRNSMLFLSEDGDACFDKAHLARFGVYSESGFEEGGGPGMGSYRGILFGMCVCYDIFFPEILHGCSLRGASVNICCAASAVQSKPFLDTVLPARALENVTYLAYSNNIGSLNGLDMHGCSRILDPFGRTVAECGRDEGIAVAEIDTDILAECRRIRRHLDDFRSDVDWLARRCRIRWGSNRLLTKSINVMTSSSPTKPRWSSPVRREPGKLVGNFPSGVQISPSALLPISSQKPHIINIIANWVSNRCQI